MLRRALRWLAASRRWARSNCSADTSAGTGTVIHSWGGCARVLTPRSTGASADQRRWRGWCAAVGWPPRLCRPGWSAAAGWSSPARSACRSGRHPPCRQLRGQPVQGHPADRVGGKQLLDHDRCDRVQLHQGRVAGRSGVQPVAVGRPCPGRQLPAAQPRLPAAPHPVGDQGPLAGGDRTADLGDQLLVRVVGERPIAEHHRHTAALQFLQDHHLVGEVAGQPVRRADHRHVERRAGCMVAQRVQAGTVQLGAAVAVTWEDVLGGDGPPVAGRNIGPQLGDLLLDVWACCWRSVDTRTYNAARIGGSFLLCCRRRRRPTNTSWYARSHRACPSGCSLVSRRTSKVRRMAAPPRCQRLPRRGTPAGLPLPQRPPPPVQTKLAMTGPAELVTCDQTIEHTIRFCKQTLGWTTPRVRTPAQAERWTWLILACYAQLRLARELVADQRLAWERPQPPARLSPVRVCRGFPRLLVRLGSPAAAPKPAGRSPGRPKGRASGPATRYPAIKKPTRKPRNKPPTTAKAA